MKTKFSILLILTKATQKPLQRECTIIIYFVQVSWPNALYLSVVIYFAKENVRKNIRANECEANPHGK